MKSLTVFVLPIEDGKINDGRDNPDDDKQEDLKGGRHVRSPQAPGLSVGGWCRHDVLIQISWIQTANRRRGIL